mgnify:FL=1|tara:strand:+ start:1566 stop:1865 length:300 start_codon:yes stop_codon:yes gene_type:complete
MRISEIIAKEFAPTKTAKQVAYNAQADAAFWKSKLAPTPLNKDTMVITGPNAQAKIDNKFAKANSLSKAAGVNKNAFSNDLQKSFSNNTSKFKTKFGRP